MLKKLADKGVPKTAPQPISSAATIEKLIVHADIDANKLSLLSPVIWALAPRAIEDSEASKRYAEMPHVLDMLCELTGLPKTLPLLPLLLAKMRCNLVMASPLPHASITITAGILNHSCDLNEANCQLYVMPDNLVFVRTKRPIKEGEELRINYLPNADIPIYSRRYTLDFECLCKKCDAEAALNEMFDIAAAFTKHFISKRGVLSEREAAEQLRYLIPTIWPSMSEIGCECLSECWAWLLYHRVK